uniref:F-box/SPRY domain-containing protein 1 n=1 Tax=Bursaphelenchus xylophilus TaxID=6326 RepID=A0A1I7ST31_BURXY
MARKPVSAARLPTTVLLPVFKYLCLKDLNSCARVCRQWNTIIETADRELWHTFALAEIPEAGLNDSDLFPRGTSFKHRLRAFRYAWNPQDSSRNNFLRTNGFTVHRQPIAQSTDAIRGKIGVSTGVHAYNITWKGPLGTVAVVGVATKHAALHCPGYVALLGSDDQSWGWNLVDNTLLYNGNCVGSYPRLNNPPKYQVGEKITMILDRDTETLFFEKNGEFFGIAFENIPPVKLFPAICAVYGNTEVSMAYAGTPLAG